jgi:hypothetical protein
MADTPAPMTERERQLTAENKELVGLVETLRQDKVDLQLEILAMKDFIRQAHALVMRMGNPQATTQSD